MSEGVLHLEGNGKYFYCPDAPSCEYCSETIRENDQAYICLDTHNPRGINQLFCSECENKPSGVTLCGNRKEAEHTHWPVYVKIGQAPDESLIL